MGQSALSAEKVVIKNELEYKGTTLLTYNIEYPRFHGSVYRECLNAVNSFYRSKALMFQNHCEHELFKLAVEQYKLDLKQGFPLRVFDAALVYEIPYCEGCIISIYSDRYEYAGGAHGSTVRQSQTWNLQKCGMMKLGQIVRCSTGVKTHVLKAVKDQIRQDPASYFEDYAQLVSESFNQNQFYCTPEALVFYYQQYDIAPYAAGIREFSLPYEGCVTDPSATCFYV